VRSSAALQHLAAQRRKQVQRFPLGWFAFGFPGFGSVLLITWLMIAKPGF
jgi:uncharacterized membrane protein